MSYNGNSLHAGHSNGVTVASSDHSQDQLGVTVNFWNFVVRHLYFRLLFLTLSKSDSNTIPDELPEVGSGPQGHMLPDERVC